MGDSKPIVFIKRKDDTDPDIEKKTKEEWEKFLYNNPQYKDGHDRELGLYKKAAGEKLSERFGQAVIEISGSYLEELFSFMGYEVFSSRFGSYLDLYEASEGEGVEKFLEFVKGGINFFYSHEMAADLWKGGHIGATETEFLRAKSDITSILYGEMGSLLDMWKEAGAKFVNGEIKP